MTKKDINKYKKLSREIELFSVKLKSNLSIGEFNVPDCNDWQAGMMQGSLDSADHSLLCVKIFLDMIIEGYEKK